MTIGAITQVSGVTYEDNLCGANAEESALGWEEAGTAYAVYFTFNSANYDVRFQHQHFQRSDWLRHVDRQHL